MNVNNGRRITRKPHQCAYCALDIPVGTHTVWWTWTESDQIETSYGHQECQAAYQWYLREYGAAVDDHLPDPADFRSEILVDFRATKAGAA